MKVNDAIWVKDKAKTKALLEERAAKKAKAAAWVAKAQAKRQARKDRALAWLEGLTSDQVRVIAATSKRIYAAILARDYGVSVRLIHILRNSSQEKIEKYIADCY